MQELNHALETFENPNTHAGLEVIEAAAQKWAEFALKSYRDKLLKKALGISGALMDFVTEMKGKE